MNDDIQQAKRILEKLALARAADPNLEVFGASSHGYVLSTPASPEIVRQIEERLAIELPQCFRRFLLEVGNGGEGNNSSGAGPFYGIYDLSEEPYFNDLYRQAEVVAKPCLLSPGMSQPEWQKLMANVGWTDELEDDAYTAAMDTLFGGLLPLGTQGCSCFHGIVMNGPHVGRVVNWDIELAGPPHFAYESDFLDWYERWLEEVLSGDLLQGGPSWFGYTRGGPESELVAGWLRTEGADDGQEYLVGLLVKKRLSDETLDALIRHYPERSGAREQICRIICKHRFDRARPFLLEQAALSPLSFLQCLFWYGRAHAASWQSQILSLTPRITSLEAFSFFSQILEALPIDTGAVLAPFTRHELIGIRRQALYALGKASNRDQYLDCFIDGLADAEATVVRSALQALHGVSSRSLLPHYRRVAERFPEERDHVLVNLDHRLKELGMTRADLMRTSTGDGVGIGFGSGLKRFARRLFYR